MNNVKSTQVIKGLVDGNTKSMENAGIYQRIGEVLAYLQQVPVKLVQDWGPQDLEAGDFVIIDPGADGNPTRNWGIERRTFTATYEPVPGKPGWYRKTAKIRAIQMDEPFLVQSLDSETPEKGNAGDWLVENIRADGSVQDRYLIEAEQFPRLYKISS